MRNPVTLALLGDAPALAAVLAEHAEHAGPSMRFMVMPGKDSADADILIAAANSATELAQRLAALKAAKTQAARLLVLGEDLPEPEEEADALGLAGIFRMPLRLAALLDAGFSARRLADLKSPRRLDGGVVFDPFTRRLESADGRAETLTPKEADFLLALLEAGEKGLARAAALTGIWGYHREADSHAVETAAWRLRRKLEALYQRAGLLESREGMFYLSGM